jgi:uncharacterized repeat protein (TIGR04076 family)
MSEVIHHEPSHHPEAFKVKATLKSFTNKPCPNYKIGDSWIVEIFRTPEGMCPSIFFNVNAAMLYMLDHPECEVYEIQCVDTKTISVYELTRVNSATNPE